MTEDETSVQRGGSARLWTRNQLVDVISEIAQPKRGSIPRPVATCRNGRYFYRTCQDQRRSDGRSCLNFSRFHFSSLSSPLRPPFRDARRRSNRSRRAPHQTRSTSDCQSGSIGAAPLPPHVRDLRCRSTSRLVSALRFTALEDVAPPIQHLLAGKPQLFPRACEEPPRHHFCRRPRRYDRDLGRHEARRQPPADDRPLFHWFARDECLKDGADTCARGVTVAAFFNRPRAVDDADDHVGGGRDAFLSDDKLELAHTGGSHARCRWRPGVRVHYEQSYRSATDALTV